jgi:voltage-gated potassium channel
LLLLRRIAIAVGALLAAAVVVYVGREGYVDSTDTPITFGDALYYATVSLSTTGYGDIAPVSDEARLTTTTVITLLRVVFLIVLVGTTVELLADHSRHVIRVRRWRSRIGGHVVVAGFDTKGQAAIRTLLAGEARTRKAAAEIVIVDRDPARLDTAVALGFVSVAGDATRSDVLRSAGIERARALVVATGRDDTAPTGDPDGPPTRTRVAHRRRRPTERERTPASTRRRGFGDRLHRDGGPAARPRRTRP